LRSAACLIERLLRDVDPIVAQAVDKALDGRDLTVEEAAELLEARGLEVELMVLAADYLRFKAVGDVVTFVVNRNINFTNECTVNCAFCAFSKPPGDPEAYTLSLEEVARRAAEAQRMGATEVCMQGAINPKLPPTYYFDVLEAVKKAAPSIHIHAYSPQEIYSLASRLDAPYHEVLKALKDSGLDSMPGTAAEILDDEVRRVIAPRKIGVKTWVEIIRTAHRLGIPTTATMMYGHVDEAIHKARHLNIIREIQRETRGFTEFVPLPFIHQRTKLYREGLARPGSTGFEDLKVYAASRLFLNNYVRNLQVSWVKLTPKFAQVALGAGANDFGGTLMEENISRAAGATSGTHMAVEEIVRLIRDAGRTPAQRSTTYEVLKVY
jgi:7,8-didemethyl-8-hydroxy-5-deazariboflavin synthase CofH subunit